MYKENSMDNEQLKRCLMSIGKATFVKHYKMFTNRVYSNRDLVEFLMEAEGYTKNSARTKVSQSRRIIKCGRAKDAFEMIADSSIRVPTAIKDQARQLAKTL